MAKCKSCGEMPRPVSGNPHRCGGGRSGVPRSTMTLNMPDREMGLLEILSRERGMTKTAVVRQALRMYHYVEDRAGKGQRMFWKDKDGNEVTEVVLSPFGVGWEGMD